MDQTQNVLAVLHIGALHHRPAFGVSVNAEPDLSMQHTHTHMEFTWVLMRVVGITSTVLSHIHQFPQPSHICRERIVAPLLQHVPREDSVVHTRGLLLSTAGSPGRLRYLARRYRTFQTELHQSHLSHLSHADVSN